MKNTSVPYEVVNIENTEVKIRFINTKKRSEELQKEIESKYQKEGKNAFGRENDDIRQKLFNFDNPYYLKEIGQHTYRLAEGLIKDNQKTYLFYFDDIIVFELYSPISTLKKVLDTLVAAYVIELVKKNKAKSQLNKELEQIGRFTETGIDGVKGILDAMLASKIKDQDLALNLKRSALTYNKKLDKKITDIWKTIEPNYKGDLIGNQYYQLVSNLIEMVDGNEKFGLLKRYKENM